jgi:uncharacterized membrane protein YidH (DUF202 family)
MPTQKRKMKKKVSEVTLLSEIQLLLSEKRTYFALLRTGLAVFTVPLTVIVFLVATSNYHKLFADSSISFVTIAALLIIAISGLSVFYIASRKLKNISQLIKRIKREDKRLSRIVV